MRRRASAPQAAAAQVHAGSVRGRGVPESPRYRAWRVRVRCCWSRRAASLRRLTSAPRTVAAARAHAGSLRAMCPPGTPGCRAWRARTRRSAIAPRAVAAVPAQAGSLSARGPSETPGCRARRTPGAWGIRQRSMMQAAAAAFPRCGLLSSACIRHCPSITSSQKTADAAKPGTAWRGFSHLARPPFITSAALADACLRQRGLCRGLAVRVHAECEHMSGVP